MTRTKKIPGGRSLPGKTKRQMMKTVDSGIQNPVFKFQSPDF